MKVGDRVKVARGSFAGVYGTISKVDDGAHLRYIVKFDKPQESLDFTWDNLAFNESELEAQ